MGSGERNWSMFCFQKFQFLCSKSSLLQQYGERMVRLSTANTYSYRKGTHTHTVVILEGIQCSLFVVHYFASSLSFSGCLVWGVCGLAAEASVFGHTGQWWVVSGTPNCRCTQQELNRKTMICNIIQHAMWSPWKVKALTETMKSSHSQTFCISPGLSLTDTLYFFGDNNFTEWHSLFENYKAPRYMLPHTTGAYSFGIAGQWICGPVWLS